MVLIFSTFIYDPVLQYHPSSKFCHRLVKLTQVQISEKSRNKVKHFLKLNQHNIYDLMKLYGFFLTESNIMAYKYMK